MFALLTIACLAAAAAARLPDVFVGHKDGALEFKMPDSPGLREVFFDYLLDSLTDEVIPRKGKAVKKDGFWHLKDEDIKLKPGDKLQYHASGWDTIGKRLGPVCKWVFAPYLSQDPWRTRAVMFREDFSGKSLDLNRWKYEVSMFGGMNWEFQVYTNQEDNVFLRNGKLNLKPTLTVDDPKFDEDFLTQGTMDVIKLWGECTNAGNYGCLREGRYGMLPTIMSGKVTTRATLRYGTVEVRARIPKGDWIWPAIWMLPKTNEYGTWPRSGEIDIMESHGNAKALDKEGNNHGVNEVSSTLHWGTAWDDNYYNYTHAEKFRKQGNWHDSFHTWRLDWTPDYLATYIDDEEILRVQPPSGGFYELGEMKAENPWYSGNFMAPFDQEFFLILNVAVGGTVGFFSDDYDYDVEKPWTNDSPHANADFWANHSDWLKTWRGNCVAMEVDYVEFRHL